MKKIASHSGFTLIELLIVVLIIGILAELAIPRFQEAVREAKYSQAKVQMNAIYKALQAFYGQYGGYPADVYQNEPPPGLVSNFLDAWPDSSDDPFHTAYDYEAWPCGTGGGYWIGVVYMGYNRMRDTGLYGGCYFVQNGVDGMIQRHKDDLGMQVSGSAGIVTEGIDLSHYNRLNSHCYRYIW